MLLFSLSVDVGIGFISTLTNELKEIFRCYSSIIDT